MVDNKEAFSVWVLGGVCLLFAGMVFGLQLLWPITLDLLNLNLLIGVPFLLAQACFVIGVIIFFFGKM